MDQSTPTPQDASLPDNAMSHHEIDSPQSHETPDDTQSGTHSELTTPRRERRRRLIHTPIYRSRSEVARSLGALCVLIFVASLLTTGLAIPFAGVAGLATRAGTQAFKDLPDEFKPLPPSEQSQLLASDGSVLARFYAEDRIVVADDNISPWLKKAAVAIEDRRFYQHKGIDPQGLARAIFLNVTGDQMQGASTITQQYVKNTRIEIGLQQGDDEAVREASAPTIKRKILEARYALSLEQKMSKKEILSGYLNIAPFGPNVYGAESASLHYFSKHAKDLTLAEGALLAGLTQSPVEYDPTRNPDKAQNRRDQVLYAMLDTKMITKEEYEEAKALKVEDQLSVSDNVAGCQAAGSAAYFCQFVVSEIYHSDKFGKTVGERRRLLTRGGLKIHSTLDLAKQEEAQKAVEGRTPINDPSGAKTALVSIEPGTGKIVAMAQNTHFGNPTDDDPSATQNSFTVDKSHGGGAGFQPGSAYKPITLATWFESGHWASDIVGGRYSFQANEFHSSCPDKAEPGAYSFQNSNGKGTGRTTVSVGTMNSLNSTFVDMASKLDLCDIRKMVEKVHALPGDDSEAIMRPSAVIGGAYSVTPINMANAFATWASGGTYCTPIAIDAVENRDGKKMEIPSANCHQTVDKTVSYQTMQTLRQNYNFYGSKVYTGRQAAAKTGTTDSAANAWFVGTTPNLSTAIWTGHSEGNVPMLNVTIGGQYYPVVWGDTIPAFTWGDYMRAIVSSLPNESFPYANINNPVSQRNKTKHDSHESSESSSSTTDDEESTDEE